MLVGVSWFFFFPGGDGNIGKGRWLEFRRLPFRSQQKILGAVREPGQGMQFSESKKKGCGLVLEELPAELDANHRKLILSVLSKMNIQLFITAIDVDQIDLSAWDINKMFHVEHGRVNSE